MSWQKEKRWRRFCGNESKASNQSLEPTALCIFTGDIMLGNIQPIDEANSESFASRLAHSGIISACLPRQAAVAYLYLVRHLRCSFLNTNPAQYVCKTNS